MQKILTLILKQCKMVVFKKWTAEILFLVLIVAGYTICSSFAIPLKIDNSRLFSVPYRFFIFLFSFYIINKNFSFKRLISIPVVSIFLFWIFYFIKSLISFHADIYNPEFAASFSEIYSRVLVIAFIPSTALLFINYKKIDLESVVKSFFYIMLVMLTLNLIYGLIMPSYNLVNKNDSLRYIFSIYYISYGHLGTTLAILSFFFIFFKPRVLPKYLVVYGLFLGLLTLTIAGARSPILGMFVVLVYFLLLKKNFKLFAGFGILFITSIILIYFFGQSGDSKIVLVNRTYNWIFKGDMSLRGPLFKQALEIFQNNPIFGGRTHYENGMYPHNLFLELLMATGIFGFILYFLKFIPLIKKISLFIFKIKNFYYILFFAIALQYFVLVCTSFTLYSVPEFLYFCSIIIGISLNHQNEEIESNDGCGNTARNNQVSQSA